MVIKFIKALLSNLTLAYLFLTEQINCQQPCISNDLQCIQCDQQDINLCIKCQIDYFPIVQYGQSLSKCELEYIGPYFSQSNGVLYSCNEECGACIDGIDLCNSCKDVNKYLFNQQCFVDKPLGAFCGNSYDKCIPCSDQYCHNCSITYQSCQKCDQSSSHKYLFQQKCQENRPLNSTCNVDNICEVSCLPHCKICAGQDCIECDEGFTLQNAQCYCKYSTQTYDENEGKCRCKDDEYELNNACFQQIPDKSYCDSTKKCQQCNNSQCQKCQSDLMICNECIINSYYYQNECLREQPKNTYCKTENQINLCEECNQLCNGCKGPSENECDLCVSNSYHFQKSCLKEKPKNSFCIFKNEIYFCEKCHPSCSECTGPSEKECKGCIGDSFYYQNACFTEKPKNTYCKKEDAQTLCMACHEKCQECFGLSQDECLSCQKGSELKNNACKQNILVYESTFSEAKVQQIQQQVSAASQTSSVSSAVLSTSQNFISQSSFGMLISGINSQKLTLMILIDTELPSPVFAPLKSTQDQLPSHQMDFLDIFSLVLPRSSSQTNNEFLNIKFESIQLRYSILHTCGAGVSIFLICSLLFALFYIGIEKTKEESKIKKYSQFIYSKIFSGFIVQYFQLLVSMFTTGVNTQFLEFMYETHLEQLSIKIPLTIVIILIIILIVYKVYYYLNHQSILANKMTFFEITREKILNQTIFQSKIRRNYMLILLVVESIITPTIFIQFNFHSITVSSLAILLQLAFLISTCFLMPFHSKLTNGNFIVTSFLWLVFYIVYYLLNIYSTKSNINDYATTLDNLSWSFILILQIILLINPIYMALTLVSLLVNKIRQRLLNIKQRKEDLIEKSFFFNKIEIFNTNEKNYKSMIQELELNNTYNQISTATLPINNN